MESIILTIALAILSSTVINTIVTFVLERIKDRKHHRNRYDEALRLILLAEIKKQGKFFIEQGEIEALDLQAFNEGYRCYKELGGDGYADTIHEKVNGLNKIL